MGRFRAGLVSSVWVLLLFVAVFGVVLNVSVASGQSGTIYIRADGSIDPPIAPISTSDNVTYTFTGNINDSIVVERDNIVLDGPGYTVEGGGSGTAIDLSQRNNVTVKNTTIKNSYYGMYLNHTNKIALINNNIANNGIGILLNSSLISIVSGNNITNNDWAGVGLISSSNNSISGNNITNNTWDGIGLTSSSNSNSISGNNIANNHDGVYLSDSSSNSIYHNNFRDNTQQEDMLNNTWDHGYPSGGNYWSNYNGTDSDGDGIGDTPYIIDENNQDRYPLMHSWSSLQVHNMNTGLGYETIQRAIDANETLNGHTIFAEAGTYYENVVVNKTVTLVGESRKCTIIDGNKTAEAVTIVSNDTSLSGFTVQSSAPLIVAIRLENVSHVTIVDNTITNSFSGLILSLSSSNTISHNNITGNTFRNSFANSSDNILTDNTIDGLSIWSSNNNTLESNMIGSFELSYSLNTKLRNNSISAFGVYGNAYSHFVHDIDSSNTLLGKPVCYWVNCEDAEVPSGTGYVALVNCMNITVRDLDLGDNYQSIMVFSTNNSRILNNNVTRTNDGIWVLSSSNNTISGNNIANNGNGILLDSSSNHNSISGNNVTANNSNGVYLTYSSDNSIVGNNITANDDGIKLYFSSSNNIVGNYITANQWAGIDCYSSDDLSIVGNRITKSNYGIYSDWSDSNGFSGNDITNNGLGLDILHSSHSSVVGNNITDNVQGIQLYQADNNSIIGNKITNNLYGICLTYASNYNDVIGNNIENNNDGIKLSEAPDNQIYYNNFINNTKDADNYNSLNFWDNGVEGNYWSDYSGTDLYSGPYQNETGSDGIGDTPHTIDANNTDYFPLMGMFHSYNVTYFTLPMVGHFCKVTVISNSTISGFVAPIWLEHPEVIGLTFNVTGTNDSTGFCRVSFPTAMMNGTYQVSVNGTEVPCILLPCSNADISYLYFNYTHSTEQVIILPEFPSSIILPLFMIATLLAVIVYKRKRTSKVNGR